jgi:PAS domain S-box-containing protein
VDFEEKLIISEQQFRSVIESSPMGVHLYKLDSEGRLVLEGSNAASDKILGITTSDLIGKTLEEAFPPLKVTEIPHRYRDAAVNGIYWKTEQINYHDEKITGAYEVHAFQTRPGAMAVFFMDVSERIRAREEIRHLHETLEHKYAKRTRELEEAKEHLVESEKMSSLGRLVAGISHEINTPIGVCKTGISYIEDLVGEMQGKFLKGELSSSDFEENLKSITECAASSHKSIDRAASLTKSFKMVAVDQSNEEIRVFNVRSYVDEILISLHNQIKKSAVKLI